MEIVSLCDHRYTPDTGRALSLSPPLSSSLTFIDSSMSRGKVRGASAHRRCDRTWKIRVFFPLLLRGISPPPPLHYPRNGPPRGRRYRSILLRGSPLQRDGGEGKIRNPGHDSSTVHVPFCDRRMSIYRTRENGDRSLVEYLSRLECRRVMMPYERFVFSGPATFGIQRSLQACVIRSDGT